MQTTDSAVSSSTGASLRGLSSGPSPTLLSEGSLVEEARAILGARRLNLGTSLVLIAVWPISLDHVGYKSEAALNVLSNYDSERGVIKGLGGRVLAITMRNDS